LSARRPTQPAESPDPLLRGKVPVLEIKSRELPPRSRDFEKNKPTFPPGLLIWGKFAGLETKSRELPPSSRDFGKNKQNSSSGRLICGKFEGTSVWVARLLKKQGELPAGSAYLGEVLGTLRRNPENFRQIRRLWKK
jgi:hypothetical protein